MPQSAHHSDINLDVDSLALIVVGAHPRAEAHDRSIAYSLSRTIASWLDARFPSASPATPPPLTPLVCSDVWYLNDQSLRDCPAISIGNPSVNALSAYLADKLPSAFVIDDLLMVQLDLEFADLTACCWGINPSDTATAVNVFSERYLDAFMRASLRAEE